MSPRKKSAQRRVKAGAAPVARTIKLSEFLRARDSEQYARRLFDSVAGGLRSGDDVGKLQTAIAAHSPAPPIFHKLFAEDSEDRAQIISHKFSVAGLAALSEMAVTHELSQLKGELQRGPLHAELDVLQLVRVAHTRRLLGIESAEGEGILEQLHRVVLKYGEAVQREHSLYDAGETMRQNSNVATPPLIPRVTQPHAVKRLRHFGGLLYDAFQRCNRNRERAAVARIYVTKMADAACQLGFDSGPIAGSYSGKLFEKACTRLLSDDDARGKRKCVDALFRYALRLRGLSETKARKLSEIER